MENINGIIYKITNLINGKIYIGQTIKSLKRRMFAHKRARWKYPICYAINKYGFENFKFEIIDEAENLLELNDLEIKYIKEFDSANKEIGYNIHEGGRNSIPNNETRLKMSISHKGKKHSKEWTEKRISTKGSTEALKYGKPKTEEDKKKISENSPKFWQGKKRSKETIEKIIKTKKNNPTILSNSFKEKYCRKVCKVNSITNEIIEIYESISDAGRKNVDIINKSTIIKRCNGKSKNIGNIYWVFLENYNSNL